MELTPPLPRSGATPSSTVRSPAAPQAHRVLLYYALEAAGRSLETGDVQAVFAVAELDAVTVQAVVTWITTAGDPSSVR
ncbi:hypothetical protein [Streptomyces bauhiniae]|uniref:Uncharacterized protein n=1 Tax=Streptomyces bauhiniae TaxID=2340725 RepID=A0A7K3QW47_9ACTN|nr:hypothetical protein [Streptomyces bauhiniae]NEB94045.1 hypothetical protein [Streptomyces bauhiniae]